MRPIHVSPADSLPSEARMLAQLADFAAVRARIKVRLHGGTAPPPGGKLLVRPIAEGLVALLVCDFGPANIGVPRATAERWGLSSEELWALAVDNLRAEPRLQVMRGAPRGARAVDMLAGETPFASSHLLFFERYMRGAPGYGALFTVPQRHVILRHRIRDASVLGVVPFLRAMTDDAFARGPGAISRGIYWWRPGGAIERLELFTAGDALVVAPSARFQREVIGKVIRAA
ncbi:MAG: hypothetical protein U0359_29555 [Byssovorax sp.]